MNPIPMADLQHYLIEFTRNGKKVAEMSFLDFHRLTTLQKVDFLRIQEAEGREYYIKDLLAGPQPQYCQSSKTRVARALD